MSQETQDHQDFVNRENARQQWQHQLDEQVAIYGSPCCRGAYIAGRIDGLQERMQKHNAELDRMIGAVRFNHYLSDEIETQPQEIKSNAEVRQSQVS